MSVRGGYKTKRHGTVQACVRITQKAQKRIGWRKPRSAVKLTLKLGDLEGLGREVVQKWWRERKGSPLAAERRVMAHLWE